MSADKASHPSRGECPQPRTVYTAPAPAPRPMPAAESFHKGDLANHGLEKKG